MVRVADAPTNQVDPLQAAALWEIGCLTRVAGFGRLPPVALAYPCMRRFSPTLALGLAATAWICGCSSHDIPEVPQGVTAGGGYWGACPRAPEEEKYPLAPSPEFNTRLTTRFPPGSSEQRLVDSLAASGFRSVGTCDQDRSIRIFRLDRRGRGITAEYFSVVSMPPFDPL